MRFALYTNIISPHQLPLARELIAIVGRANYRYIYSEQLHKERSEMGWDAKSNGVITLHETETEAQNWLETCDVLICCPRNIELIERRCKAKLITLYSNERWFKPPIGRFRMIVPSFCRMAIGFIKLIRKYDNFLALPIGVHARDDFLWLGVPKHKLVTWGYFVSPSTYQTIKSRNFNEGPLKLLWVGRLIKLKHVDTIIRAVKKLENKIDLRLTIVGDGPEKRRLIRLANGSKNIEFLPSMPIDHVRNVMRCHDVYVFSSNGYDGWGAVVSEALEEGMCVLGTIESGAPATVLPEDHVFHCGDARQLSKLIENVRMLSKNEIGEWSAKRGAQRLLALSQKIKSNLK